MKKVIFFLIFLIIFNSGVISAQTNIPPVADAGPDQEVTEGDIVTFNGSDSYDPDGVVVAYEWAFGDGTNGSGEITTHNYSTYGTYEVILTVYDDQSSNDTDKMVVYVNRVGNSRPVADAGLNQSHYGWRVPVTLNGSNSSDSDGDNLIFSWDFDASVDSDGDGDYINDENAAGIVVTNTFGYGNHTITLTVNDGHGRASKDTTLIQILAPYAILLVDDDSDDSNGSDNFVSYYTDALDMAGYTYDLYTVPSKSVGPSLSELTDYEVVVWFTGNDIYEPGVSRTLFEEDEDNLANYLDGGGKLWLLSINFLWDNGLDEFAQDYLRIDEFNYGEDIPNPLEGLTGDPIGDGLNYSTSDPGYDSLPDRIQPRSGAFGVFWHDAAQTGYSAIRYEDRSTRSRMVFFTIPLPTISNLEDRAELDDRVLEWMGAPVADLGQEKIKIVNVSDVVAFDGSNSSDPDDYERLEYQWDFGDGSANSFDVNTTHVYTNAGEYTVTLTVNDGRGHSDIDTTRIFVNDPTSNNPPTADAGSDKTAYVGNLVIFDGSNSSDPENDTLSYYWDYGDGGSGTGVNPAHVYTDEGNYTVTLTVNDGKGGAAQATLAMNVSTEFKILVVDDDGGHKNGYYHGDIEYFITKALRNAVYEYDLTRVDYSSNGPSLSTLSEYDVVIWLTGKDWEYTLTNSDESNLGSYLDGGGMLWLISQDFLFNNGLDSFAQNYLYVESYADDVGTPNPLIGVSGDLIGQGLNYSTAIPETFMDYGDWIQPDGDSYPIFWQDVNQTRYGAIRYGSNVTTYKTVFFSFDFAMISNKTDRSEFADRVLQWMFNGTVDTTPPTINVTSPQNVTYGSNSVTLNYTVNEATSWEGVSLDGNANQTGGNRTLTGLSDGQHNITVYAYDTRGNLNSITRYFNVSIPPPANLTITYNDNGTITLTWNGSAASYDIYITNNYSAGFNLSNPNVTNVTETSWTDLDAINYGQRYYKVGVTDATGSISNETVGKFDIELYPGQNMVSLPLIPQNNSINEVLHQNDTFYPINEIAALDAGGDYDIATFYSENAPDYWWSPENFTTLDNDKGYWFKLSQDYNFTLVGEVPTSNRSVNLTQGFNLVGWTSLEERKLWNAINQSGSDYNVTEIYSLTPSGDYMISTFYSDNTPDYWWRLDPFDSLSPGKAYWLDVNQSYTWSYTP